jgi:hypothetical protein
MSQFRISSARMQQTPRPCFGDESTALFKGAHVANRVAALRTALERAVHEKKAVLQRLGIPSTAALKATAAHIDLQRTKLKTLVGDGDETVSNLRRNSDGVGRNWKRFCRSAQAMAQRICGSVKYSFEPELARFAEQQALLESIHGNLELPQLHKISEEMRGLQGTERGKLEAVMAQR